MKFEQIGREEMYAGRAFKVARIEARLPNGEQRKFDLVEHPDSVSIVPVDGEGNLLFVRQYRLGAKDLLLELPAGVLDEGETPSTAAAREMREETGLAAENLSPLGEFYLAPGYASEKMTAFLATGLTDSPLDQDEDEFIEIERVPVREAYEMAARGAIRDGKSLAALLLARPYLTPFR
jgi:ADP-ribose pyrophosphatase